MKSYMVLENAFSYGLSLHNARFCTDDEKIKFSPEYRDTVLIAEDEGVELDNVSWGDVCSIVGERKPLGVFNGCSNVAYEIDAIEWENFVNLNEENKNAKKRAAINEELKDLHIQKTAAEKQMKNHRLPSVEDARRAAKAWNDANNEGGEGYVPHFYSDEEYNRICSRIKELESC